MDCCGMAMAAWPGGGYVCRRCQAKVGVPWGRDRNPLARMVTEVPVEDMAPDPEPTVVIFRGLDYGVGQGPPAVAESFPVEQPKVSGFGGRGGGRKGGSK